MSDFDILSILKFAPPQFMCSHCLALFHHELELKHEEDGSGVWCPICGFDFFEWQAGATYEINFDDLIEHTRDLARIASYKMLPMQRLYKALSQAEAFVHFITWGISHQHIGALKLTSQNVKVRGVISGVKPSLVKELKDNADEAPDLVLRTFSQSNNWEERSQIPHTKLIVIDGLLAFKGSANLTLSGWRKAARGRDTVEIVTNVREITELHNSLISPIWAETNPDEYRYSYDGTLFWSNNFR
jgi:hypothetical protein